MSIFVYGSKQTITNSVKLLLLPYGIDWDLHELTEEDTLIMVNVRLPDEHIMHQCKRATVVRFANFVDDRATALQSKQISFSDFSSETHCIIPQLWSWLVHNLPQQYAHISMLERHWKEYIVTVTGVYYDYLEDSPNFVEAVGFNQLLKEYSVETLTSLFFSEKKYINEGNCIGVLAKARGAYILEEVSHVLDYSYLRMTDSGLGVAVCVETRYVNEAGRTLLNEVTKDCEKGVAIIISLGEYNKSDLWQIRGHNVDTREIAKKLKEWFSGKPQASFVYISNKERFQLIESFIKEKLG